MFLGFGVPVSGVWATPGNQLRFVQRAEALGYRTAWTFQRLLVPAEPEPDPRSGMEVYRSVLDPVVSLAHLAGRTDRIRLGVAVLNMPFVSPALLAKQLATLDILSNGRLDVGLGVGWSKVEFAASGVPLERRGQRAEEFLRALRALWTDEVVELDGEFYRIPPARAEPKPVQRPHPPVLLGGSAEVALRRAGRVAAGWISASNADLRHIDRPIATVRQAAERAGRDPDALRFICRGPLRLGPAGAGDRRPLTGSVEQVRGDLEELRAQGVTEVFLDLNWDPEVGSPDADPDTAVGRAEEALEAFAPAGP
ncbi:MAG TPA: TIGR03619 family F420-dependent LLM class oxidoreductase [Actinomycetes bacterium]